MSILNSVNRAWDINSQKCFCKYLKIHFELGPIFKLLSIFGPPKRTNRSDHDYGAHNVQNIRSNGSRFFTNISRSEIDQQLKFWHVVVFDLLHISSSPDHDFGSHKLKKKKKKKKRTVPWGRLFHCSPKCLSASDTSHLFNYAHFAGFLKWRQIILIPFEIDCTTWVPKQSKNCFKQF